MIAFDGMPLAQPEPLTVTLIPGPGQRADLIVDVTVAPYYIARFVRTEDQEGVSQVAFPVA